MIIIKHTIASALRFIYMPGKFFFYNARNILNYAEDKYVLRHWIHGKMVGVITPCYYDMWRAKELL